MQLDLDISDATHQFVRIRVPAGSRVAVSCIAAKTVGDQSRGYWVDWRGGPTFQRPDYSGGQWANDGRLWRTVVRFQPVGVGAPVGSMHLDPQQPELWERPDYGFTLRGEDLAPTAFPADFDPQGRPDEMFYRKPFDLWLATYCDQSKQLGVWRGAPIQGAEPNHWRFGFSDAQPRYRNSSRSYDLMVDLAINTDIDHA